MSGISWTYLDLLRGTKTQIEPFKDAFRGFSGLFIGGIILLALLTSIFITLWALLWLFLGSSKVILILKVTLSIMISSQILEKTWRLRY